MLVCEWCYSLDRHELVLVTHIRDPCQFMIQRVADMERLQIMMNVINIYCDSTENVHDLLNDVKIGMLVFFILESIILIAIKWNGRKGSEVISYRCCDLFVDQLLFDSAL